MPARLQQIVLRSFAKINLRLHILGQRADGYHEVRTELQSIALHDRLTIRRAPKKLIRFHCNIPTLDSTRNLVVQAAEIFRTKTQTSSGLDIDLEKRIPVGSGMGGGSSNGAITLLGLSRLFGLEIPEQDLLDWGAALGSDVPFFFFGGRALGIGRGSEVYPLEELPKTSVLLAVPDTPMSTADAYGRLSLRLTTRVSASMIPVFCSGFLRDRETGKTQENDFEIVLFDDFPDLRRLKDDWMECGAIAAGLTGSGSALFGIFRTKQDLARAALAAAGRKLRLIKTRTLTRREYRKRIVESLQ
jgi:4-diphosphocytidyl-2-C-methyl-D-erythritol kinase